MLFDELINIPPYSLQRDKKGEILTEKLIELTNKHISLCDKYKRMMCAIGYNHEKIINYFDIPFLPVSLFKEMELKSIPDNEIFKITTSSGTTGQAVSKIFLDKTTASNQQKTLVKIVSDFTGSARMPMLIIDSPSVIKDRSMFSARGAGILGFSIFGSDKAYALDDDMKLDINNINVFLEKHKGRNILIFGFTFMIWQYLYKELLTAGFRPDFSGGIMIHGGGWKKLITESVSKDIFKSKLNELFKIETKNIHDYYGMIEQTGAIYMECEHGNLHSGIFSDVIIRRHTDFSTCDFGEKGIIQVVSVLPESYPGHSLLTEDEGVILGEDDCPCGRYGKYFEVIGRLKNAEIRGCSDTYAAQFK